MLELTKKADYSLAILTELVRRGRDGKITLSELTAMGMPKAFTAKIANSLVKAEILTPKEGRGGGYVFKRDFKNITVGEALRATEGEVRPVECVRCGASDRCYQKGFMGRLTKEIEAIFEKYTLSDLNK